MKVGNINRWARLRNRPRDSKKVIIRLDYICISKNEPGVTQERLDNDGESIKQLFTNTKMTLDLETLEKHKD